MINSGKYTEAIEQLKKYRNIDAIICPAIAYCYLIRANSREETRDQEDPQPGPHTR